MKVMTVTGFVDVEDFGIILPHEHLIMGFDWPGLWPDVSHRPDLVWQKVSIENLGELRRNYCAIRDNALLDNVDEMIKEVQLFKEAGGGTIMEMSTYGLYGDPEKLKIISERSGVYIIAGTGFYIDQTFSEEIRKMSINDMYNVMMRDINEGFPGTNIKAGIIGEVGISNFSCAEENSLRASARVQKDTGLAMNIHVGMNPEICRKIVKILKEEGANLRKVAFAHCDGSSVTDCMEFAKQEIYLESDCFGNEFYVDNGAYDGDSPWYFGSDGERLDTIVKSIEGGLGDHLFLSQDVCSKMQTVQYGGYGYSHLLENIIPMLEYRGVPSQTPVLLMHLTQKGVVKRTGVMYNKYRTPVLGAILWLAQKISI